MKQSRLQAAVLAVALLVSTAVPAQAQSTPPNNPPTATFRYTYDVTTYTFDARGSRDWDGTIVEYSWDFGDGHAEATTSPIISHYYAEPGTYYVFLTVIDDDGGHATTWRAITTCGNPGQPQCPI